LYRHAAAEFDVIVLIGNFPSILGRV
jgi:hypothetical protein